jgi:hypothetical protein
MTLCKYKNRDHQAHPVKTTLLLYTTETTDKTPLLNNAYHAKRNGGIEQNAQETSLKPARSIMPPKIDQRDDTRSSPRV